MAVNDELGLGPEQEQLLHSPNLETMLRLLSAVEAAEKKASPSKGWMFRKLHADLKLAWMARLWRPQSMGGKQTGDGGTG